MQVDPRLGTFEDVAAAAPEHAPTLVAIRSMAEDLHPDSVEVASRREKSVWWGWGPSKMKDGYAYAMPHKTHVNFGFFQGAILPDPEGLLEGTGKRLRHVKISDATLVARPAIRALFAAARDERKAATGH